MAKHTAITEYVEFTNNTIVLPAANGTATIQLKRENIGQSSRIAAHKLPKREDVNISMDHQISTVSNRYSKKITLWFKIMMRVVCFIG